jgi:hypothetical protein
MKRTLLALGLLAGCSSPGQGDKMTETDFETKIATSIAFDPALIHAGDRVVYLVKRDREDSQRYIWTAVAEEPGAVWIENKVPFDPRPMVVKTKLERSGKILEQWIGEPGGVPGQTYPNPRAGDAPKPVRDSNAAKAQTKEEPDQIVIAGRAYSCTKVTTVLTYPDGRKSTMVNWFSKDVPFPASGILGGLVKRQFGRLSMELVAGDHNGKSELVIPPK